ncbi:hypothetical protein OPQ81_010441 [Rhizoctonia solani]|nr:hypothetical protein OPQ81_010441 [Rhizoctonia solani]
MELPAGEFDGTNPGTILQHASNLLPPDFTQVLTDDHIPAALPAQHRPRILSDSSIIIGKSHNNLGYNSQELLHGPKRQRTLSVGCDPYSSTQDLDTGLGESIPPAPGTPTVISFGDGGMLEDFLGPFRDPFDTASEPKYDGTRPIGCIQVNNPRCYLPPPEHTSDKSDLDNRSSSSSYGHSTSKSHSDAGWTYCQSDGQVSYADEAAHGQQPTLRDQTKQPTPHAHIPRPHSQSNPQMISQSNPSLEYYQFPPTKAATGGRVEDHHHLGKTYCDMSTQTDPKKQDSGTQDLDGSRVGNIFSANEVGPYAGNASVHPPTHTEWMHIPMTTQVPESLDPKHAPGMPNGLHGSLSADNPAGAMSAPTLDINIQSAEGQPPLSILHNPGSTSFTQSLTPHHQPFPSDNFPNYYESCTWSDNQLIPVASSEIQRTVAVPEPRRSLNFSAFLTPDPPRQHSNIDLPPRPDTSPPQQTSALDGGSRLLPNIAAGRRQSEQAWQSYSSQFDWVQPPGAPRYPENLNYLEGNYAYPPQAPEVPQTQPWVHGESQSEGGFASANYGQAPVRNPKDRPLTTAACTSQLPFKERPATGLQGGLGNRKPGKPQRRTIANSTLRPKAGKQQHTVQQNQLDSQSDLMLKRPITREPVSPTVRSKYTQDWIAQQPHIPSSKPLTQTAPFTIQQHRFKGEPATNRKHGDSKPDDISVAKKRKVAVKDPEVTNTKPDARRQHNLSTVEDDCGHFDANTWRSYDIPNQDVRQSIPTGSNTQAQPQVEDKEFTVLSLGESTVVASGNSTENMPSSEPPQGSYYDVGTLPSAAAEGCPSELQRVTEGEDPYHIDFMNWDPSVDVLLNQTTGFNSEAITESGAPGQYADVLNSLKDQAPEPSASAFSWDSGVPNHPLNDQFLADCYNFDMSSVMA